MSDVNRLNDVIHAKARLAIMSLVMMHGACDFAFLKKKLELTDGNLGAHIRRLEEAGYVDVEKTFVKRKPKTTVRPTETGKQAYDEYVRTLERLLYGKDEQE